MAAGCLGPAALEEQELLLHRGEVLALGSRLREALETYSAALHLGPLRPEQLGVLVDCLLRSYRARQGSDQGPAGLPTPMLQCPGCRRRFLARPVVAPCGHCYCSRCLCGGLRARCRLCGGQLLGPGQEAARARPCVLLAQLAHKWFPRESGRARAARRVWRLLRAGSPLAALRAAEEALEAEPCDLILRVYSAESHAGLHEFQMALEELNALLLKAPDWSEVYYWKAKVLHATGSVNDSLELFLQCLALDEDFLPAKLEIEKILCDLLSPVPEDVKEGLKESSWSSPAHIRNKPFMLATETEESENHPILCPEQTSEVPKTDNECFRTGLNRAQSVYVLNSVEKVAKEDGLKRVSSEPLLSGEEKGSLLKRKLSASEQERPVCEDARNKHKKQEEILAMSFACETIPLDLVDAADFECSLCIRLLFEPVTTPCGHTFCKKCLERCLDHSPQCPLCKENLTTYLARRKYIITQLLEELIMKYLPDEFEERKRMFDEETAELSNLTRNVPVFVCTMAYPTVPCPLHVFEPRYRLMIRRCMETGTKQFGMCASDPQKSFADYGCMLQIRNVHFLPDGRSVVDTVGGKRFRVLQRQMKDGYHTADIEYLEDEKIEDDEELQQLQELNDVVYNEACCWFQNLKNKFRNQILHHFGPMPERTNILQETSNGPSWCWWLLAVLPVDPKYQLSVLSMTSLKERLMKLQQILAYFSREQPK